ncbi:sugar phosphate nucleotidyltransferase [Phenylobacterium terrae]|uniref:Sugar phosphate nucleotidyltransferase n=1 Tax=Phenylobacterium terrae TaxID=2665495 RepID=A0ABW4N3K2_9CAUL
MRPGMLRDVIGLTMGRNGSVRDALDIIDRQEPKIALVVDQDRRLQGVVTDGDIRRFLLRGGDISAPISLAMNEDPVVAPTDWDPELVLLTMRVRSLRQVPVVDEGRRLLGVYVAPERIITSQMPAPVLIMAGGKGSRLAPFTDLVPKPMLDIAGTPMLEIIIRRLVLQGFTKFYLAIHHLGHIIQDHFGDGSRWGCSIDYVEEEAPLGTGGALGLLPPHVTGDVLVMNGDLLTTLDCARMVAFHKARDAALTVCARAHEMEVPFGVITQVDGIVRGIVEKPVHRTLVNSGVYVVSQSARRYIAPGVPMLMTDLISELILQRETVASFLSRAEWVDVGRPDDLRRVREQAELASRLGWLHEPAGLEPEPWGLEEEPAAAETGLILGDLRPAQLAG